MSLNAGQLAVTGLIICLNIRSFYLFYSDKKRSEQNKYRISEKKLLVSAALLGGAGAWMGSFIFRHKTRKSVFQYTLPVFFIFTVFIYMLLILQ